MKQFLDQKDIVKYFFPNDEVFVSESREEEMKNVINSIGTNFREKFGLEKTKNELGGYFHNSEMKKAVFGQFLFKGFLSDAQVKYISFLDPITGKKEGEIYVHF